MAEPFEVTTSMKTELCRLASALNVECDGPFDINEFSFFDTLEAAVRAVERLKYDLETNAPKSEKVAKPMVQKKILTKAKTLEDELRLSLNIVEDVGALKEKNLKLMNNIKKEKEQRSILEDFIASQNKKIKLLIEHVEKLMKAIKIESANKIKACDESRALLKKQKELEDKIEKQEKIMATQLRAIKQLSEGSKVLEDQLSLMDEKYLDLRCKLDTNRSILQREIIKVKKESDNLRLKYSVATNGQMLDNVSLKSYNQQMQMQQQLFFGTNGGSTSFESAGYGFPAMNNTFSSTGGNGGGGGGGLGNNQFPSGNNLTVTIAGTPHASGNNLQEQYNRAVQQQQQSTMTSPKGTHPSSAGGGASPKPGSSRNPHVLNVTVPPESPTARTIGSPSARSNMIYINMTPTSASGPFGGTGGGGNQRPVSAFPGAQTTSDLHNFTGDAGGTGMAYQPGKIRPQTAGGAAAAAAAGHKKESKHINSFSRHSQFNNGELNLDKLVKKIKRKDKLAKSTDWEPADLQDLING